MELSGLEGKVAVITGAGRMRSIGRQIALAFARAGTHVVITGTGRDPSSYPEDEQAAGWRDVESVAGEVRELGSRALAVVSDVGDEGGVADLLDRTIAEFGRVDFVINNAAAARGPDRVPVIEMPADVWATVIRVKLRGTFLMSKHFGRQLIEQGEGGAIINISSIAGKVLPPNATAYAAANTGVQALAAGMAHELGPHGIRVNAICPGVIDTFRMDDVPRGSEQWQQMMERIPLGRPSEGADVPALALFLCSDQGSWITGQSWNVDGGMSVH